jgi:hypothetical protein
VGGSPIKRHRAGLLSPMKSIEKFDVACCLGGVSFYKIANSDVTISSMKILSYLIRHLYIKKMIEGPVRIENFLR